MTIDRSEMDDILAEQVEEPTPEFRRWWDLISITPEQWVNDHDGQKYWAFALIGKRVLQYFFEYGKIKYGNTSDQYELQAMIYMLNDYAGGSDLFKPMLDWRDDPFARSPT